MADVIITLDPAAVVVDGTLSLYHDADRNAGYTEVPMTALGDGRWEAVTGDLTGRFWPTVAYTVDGGLEQRLDLPYTDLPEDTDLLVSPEAIATRASIVLPLTPEQREMIVDAIGDAQSDVVAHLGRAIIPESYTETGRYPLSDEWDLTPLDDPLIAVTEVVAETYPDGSPTGYFTVTYTAGLDARTDPGLQPIRRYVRAHALNSPEVVRLWETTTTPKGSVRSVSAEGQSISHHKATLGGGGAAGSGAPGALPTLASLDRWRVAGRRAFQRRTPREGDWPYRSMDPDLRPGQWWPV